jgi:hypothetical protein
MEASAGGRFCGHGVLRGRYLLSIDIPPLLELLGEAFGPGHRFVSSEPRAGITMVEWPGSEGVSPDSGKHLFLLPHHQAASSRVVIWTWPRGRVDPEGELSVVMEEGVLLDYTLESQGEAPPWTSAELARMVAALGFTHLRNGAFSLARYPQPARPLVRKKLNGLELATSLLSSTMSLREVATEHPSIYIVHGRGMRKWITMVKDRRDRKRFREEERMKK